MILNDKDWLKRVSIAYKVFAEQEGASPSVEAFISWLYKQYGIVELKK